VEEWNDVDNWKNITNSQNSVRKKSFGGTFCFSNCHIIELDTGGLVFLVSVPIYSDVAATPIRHNGAQFGKLTSLLTNKH
jgi:hypothetical protein